MALAAHHPDRRAAWRPIVLVLVLLADHSQIAQVSARHRRAPDCYRRPRWIRKQAEWVAAAAEEVEEAQREVRQGASAKLAEQAEERARDGAGARARATGLPRGAAARRRGASRTGGRRRRARRGDHLPPARTVHPGSRSEHRLPEAPRRAGRRPPGLPAALETDRGRQLAPRAGRIPQDDNVTRAG